jgi:hypothetical protein
VSAIQYSRFLYQTYLSSQVTGHIGSVSGSFRTSPKGAVYVLCGLQSVEWNSFQAVVRRLRLRNHQEVSKLNYFRQGEKSKKRPGLHHALSESKSFLATDSCDKIYGILSLTSNGSDLVPSPNYLLPVASVYFQLLKGLLLERGFTYLFRSCEFQDPSPLFLEPDWTNLESRISYWVLLVLGKQFPGASLIESNSRRSLRTS